MSARLPGSYFRTHGDGAPMAEAAAPGFRPGEPPIARNPIVRLVYLLLGTLFLGLGALGIATPGLPTTPFLLLTAWFYARSSTRLHRWLYGHPRFGPILGDWHQHRVLRPRTKRVAIATVWVGITGSIVLIHFTVAARLFPYLALMLAAIAIAVTVFLATRRSAPPEPPTADDARSTRRPQPERL